MSHEQKVREFYDYAGIFYEKSMGNTWHHGMPEDYAAGLTTQEVAEKLNKHLVAASGLQPGEWALDFGSGVGGEVLTMARQSGARITGVCNNDNLTRRASEIAAAEGLSDLADFHTIGDTDYKTLADFPDESFDAVFFYESVCHLPQKEKFFAAAYRVLKPGRRLLGIDWLQRPFGQYRTAEQIERVMGPVNRAFSIPEHGTVGSYRLMMEMAGFGIETARDLFPRRKCFDGAPDEQRPLWLDDVDVRIREQKRALDAAREAGTFTVGMFIGVKNGNEQD